MTMRSSILRGALTSGLLTLAGCAAAPSAVDPQGPAAGRIAWLWWLLLAIGMAVYVAVVLYLAVALARRGRSAEPDAGLRTGARVVFLAGVVGPGIILLTVFGFTVATLNALALPERAGATTVHVVGHQWWWEVRYPDASVVTANEIHIPAGRPVRVILSSDDVIHSFWVPQLHGKLDLVPGMTNETWIQADRAGVYRGLCAEFCGVQHAKMGLLVIADPPEQFDAWLAAQQQPAVPPTDALALRGQQVFLGSTCVNCHTIAGTHATGRLGPDLTHFASRLTLGAATVANTPGNLGGWIADAQHIKPGNFMPPSELTGSDLKALLAYLATLE